MQLLSIERNVFSVADANSLWMKLDETSKLVEEKLDMLNVNVNKIGETVATPPASAKPRKRKRGTGNGRRGTGSGHWQGADAWRADRRRRLAYARAI